MTIVVADVGEAAGRFARFFGRATKPSPSEQSIALDRGRVELVRADAFTRMLPQIPIPSVPFMATYSIRVRSLSAIKTILAGAGIATSPLGADLLVRFPEELGQGAWIFMERSAG